MNSLLVQKYGGTSVGSPEKIRAVAQRIALAAEKPGQSMVVVVSAMGHATDELISLAQQVSPRVWEREMDVLLSAGERVSMALLSMALRDLGVEAQSLTGSQAGIITDEGHTRARIVDIRPHRILDHIKSQRDHRPTVSIVAGFQGVSREKEITTLGRGGSDTTAVALACALKPHFAQTRCEILTDVKGLYAADPRLVSSAKYLQQVSLDTVLEMAVTGAQVMHPRSLELARNHGLELWVGPAHSPSRSLQMEGTLMTPQPQTAASVSETPKVLAVSSKTGLCLFRWSPSEGEKNLGQLAQARMILHGLQIESDGAVCALLDPTELGPLAASLGTAVARDVVGVSIVGQQLQQDATLVPQFFQSLQQAGFPVLWLQAHSQSLRAYGVLSDPSKLQLVLTAIHDKMVSI